MVFFVFIRYDSRFKSEPLFYRIYVLKSNRKLGTGLIWTLVWWNGCIGGSCSSFWLGLRVVCNKNIFYRVLFYTLWRKSTLNECGFLKGFDKNIHRSVSFIAGNFLTLDCIVLLSQSYILYLYQLVFLTKK